MNTEEFPQLLKAAIVYFADLQHCHDVTVMMRWADGLKCSRCQCERVSFLTTRRIWKCLGCKARLIAQGRNKRSVWTCAVNGFRGAHRATYPERLITPCVMAGSLKGSVVRPLRQEWDHGHGGAAEWSGLHGHRAE